MANAIPDRDDAFRTFVTNFHGACGGNLTVLGITSTQLTALYDNLVEFDTKLADVSVKHNVAAAATSEKNVAKRTLREDVAELIRVVRSRDVPVGLLDQLGIGVIDPAHPVQPEQPIELSVTPYGTGVNALKWHRGTNRRGTTYVVEVSNADISGWQMIATVSRLSYRHAGQEPGFQQTYRVRAVRRGVPGLPSYTATVYGPEPIAAQTVTLKAA